MTDLSTWKNMERRIAKLFGGTRLPRSGKVEVDVDHPLYAIECKLRAELGVWGWFTELEKKAGGKLPILVLKRKGAKGELAVVRAEVLAGLLRGDD